MDSTNGRERIRVERPHINVGAVCGDKNFAVGSARYQSGVVVNAVLARELDHIADLKLR